MLQNAIRMDMEGYDFVVIHDPQPLPLICHCRHTCPWEWRCHADLSDPNPEGWEYLKPYIEEYDAVVLSLPEYAQSIAPPQLFIMPAINPFSLKNGELSRGDIIDRLQHYGVPDDLPIVAQVSRFDRWKDPEEVIEAFQAARHQVPATLVLLGNIATDDPEGQEVFESLLWRRDERIHILTVEDSALVNFLQRHATVVLQKSLREGFGLTATEAMWKRAAVVAGRCSGLTHQIEDGLNGFLVASVSEAADRLVQLLNNPELRHGLGAKAREVVRERFLLIPKLEQYFDLFSAFEPQFAVDHRRLSALNHFSRATPSSWSPEKLLSS
jgi:trehalose synthase